MELVWSIKKIRCSKRPRKRQHKTGILAYLPQKKSLMEPESYRPVILLNADYKLPARILANRMQQTLPTVMRCVKYYGESSRTMFDTIAFIRDALA
jgi:hypothetical protein